MSVVGVGAIFEDFEQLVRTRIPPLRLPQQSLLIAELLLDHAREMSNLIAHYNAAVDDALNLDMFDDSDGLPF